MNRIVLGTNDGGEVSLPANPTEKIAIVAVSGAGKSYAAGVMVEWWRRADVPVVVLDPVGIWWGLRTGADGNPAHGAAVVIMGGPHGDTGLPPAQVAAREFRSHGTSMVIDLSESTPAELQLWAAEFGEALMAPGDGPHRPSHIVLEEAPVFCPQSGAMSKYAQRCKAAWAHLARVGGNRGLGMTVVTQRAAAVDKNVLTQCGTLLLLRLAADLDRRAILDWAASNSSRINVKTVLAELSELENGVGYLWAPTWADDPESRYCKVWIGARTTWHPQRTQYGLVKTPALLAIPKPRINWGSVGSFLGIAAQITIYMALGLALYFIVTVGLKAMIGLGIIIIALGAHKG